MMIHPDHFSQPYLSFSPSSHTDQKPLFSLPPLTQEETAFALSQRILQEIRGRGWRNAKGAIAPPAGMQVAATVLLDERASSELDCAIAKLASITQPTYQAKETSQKKNSLHSLLDLLLHSDETGGCFHITGGAVLWLLIRSPNALDQLMRPFMRNSQQRAELIEAIGKAASTAPPNDIDLRFFHRLGQPNASYKQSKQEQDYFVRFITPLKQQFSPDAPLRNRYVVQTANDHFFVHTLRLHQLSIDLLCLFASARSYIAQGDAMTIKLTLNPQGTFRYELTSQNPKGSPLSSLLSALTSELEIPSPDEVNPKGIETLLSRYLQGKYLSSSEENKQVEQLFLTKWLAFLKAQPALSLGDLLAKRVDNHHGQHPNGLFLLAWHLSLLLLQANESNRETLLPLWQKIDSQRAQSPFCHPLIEHLFSLYKASEFNGTFLIMARALLSCAKAGASPLYRIKQLPHLGKKTLQIALVGQEEKGLPTLHLSLLSNSKEAIESLSTTFQQLDAGAKLRLCFACWSLCSLLQREFSFDTNAETLADPKLAPLFVPLLAEKRGQVPSEQPLWLFQGEESLSRLGQAPLFYLQASLQVAPYELIDKLLSIYLTHRESSHSSLFEQLALNRSLAPTEQLSLWLDLLKKSSGAKSLREITLIPTLLSNLAKKGSASSREELALLERATALLLLHGYLVPATELWLASYDPGRQRPKLGIELLQEQLEAAELASQEALTTPGDLLFSLFSKLCSLSLEESDETLVCHLLIKALKKGWMARSTKEGEQLKLNLAMSNRLCRSLVASETSKENNALLFAGWELLYSQSCLQYRWQPSLAPTLTRSLSSYQDPTPLRRLVQLHHRELAETLLPTQWARLLLHLSQLTEALNEPSNPLWKEEAFLLLAKSHYFDSERPLWTALLAWVLRDPLPKESLMQQAEGDLLRYLSLIAEEDTYTLMRLLLLFPGLLIHPPLRNKIEQKLCQAINDPPFSPLALQLLGKGLNYFNESFCKQLASQIDQLPQELGQQLLERFSAIHQLPVAALQAIGKAGLVQFAWSKSPRDKRCLLLDQWIGHLSKEQLFPLAKPLLDLHQHRSFAIDLLLYPQEEKKKLEAATLFQTLIRQKVPYLQECHPLLLRYFPQDCAVWLDYLKALSSLPMELASALWERAPSDAVGHKLLDRTLHSLPKEKTLTTMETHQLLDWIVKLIDRKSIGSLSLPIAFVEKLATPRLLANYSPVSLSTFFHWSLSLSPPSIAFFLLRHGSLPLYALPVDHQQKLTVDLVKALHSHHAQLTFHDNLSLLLHYQVTDTTSWKLWLQRKWPTDWEKMLVYQLPEVAYGTAMLPLLFEKVVQYLKPPQYDRFFASPLGGTFLNALPSLKPLLIQHEEKLFKLIGYLTLERPQLSTLPDESLLTLTELALERLPREDKHRTTFEALLRSIQQRNLVYRLLQNEYDYFTNSCIFYFLPLAINAQDSSSAPSPRVWTHYFINQILLKNVPESFSNDLDKSPIVQNINFFLDHQASQTELTHCIAEEFHQFYPVNFAQEARYLLIHRCCLLVETGCFLPEDLTLLITSPLFLASERRDLAVLQALYDKILSRSNLPPALENLARVRDWFPPTGSLTPFPASEVEWEARCQNFLYSREKQGTSFSSFYQRFAPLGIKIFSAKSLSEKLLFLARLLAKAHHLTSGRLKKLKKPKPHDLLGTFFVDKSHKITNSSSPPISCLAQITSPSSDPIQEANSIFDLLEQLLPCLLKGNDRAVSPKILHAFTTNLVDFCQPVIAAYAMLYSQFDLTPQTIKMLKVEQQRQLAKIRQDKKKMEAVLTQIVDQLTLLNSHKDVEQVQQICKKILAMRQPH